MLTILGIFMGILKAAVPAGISFLNKRRDQKHEVELLRIRGSMDQQSHKFRMREIETQADIESQKAVLAHDASIKDVPRWVNAYRALLRPVVVTVFVAMYIATKIVGFQSALADEMEIGQALLFIWGEFDQAIFASIISFLFGDRAIKKYYNNMHTN